MRIDTVNAGILFIYATLAQIKRCNVTMVISPKVDPCQFGGSLEQVCDRAKFNNESSGLRLSNWVLYATVVIFGDMLKWFPQIPALFPNQFAYNVANFIVDSIGIGIAFVILGFPGLLVSLLKLFDSFVIFLLGSLFPVLLPIAWWMDVIPWFLFALCTYFIYKGFILKKHDFQAM